jgi:hypothetical protein
MKRLTILVLAIAAVYSGYWFLGKHTVKDATLNGIASAQRDGWQIDYSDLSTVGFPSRFDTTVSDVSVSPPDGLWSWQAPFLQVFALSYQPNNVIVAFPPTQSLRVGDDVLQITTEALRASAGVYANTDLSLKAVTVEAGPSAATSDLGWSVKWDRALLALRDTPETERSYDLYADADQIGLPDGFAASIDAEDQLTDTIARIAVDGRIVLDQQLDRHAVEPLAEVIELKSLVLDWGQVSVSAKGELEIDAAGIPEGRITFKTAQWRILIELAEGSGLIDPGVVPTVTNLANAMADGGGMLELPISFQSGFMSLGPLPLGPAPRLR